MDVIISGDDNLASSNKFANMNIKQTKIYIKRMFILINGFIRMIETQLNSNQIIPESINEVCYTYYYNSICYLSLNGLILEDIHTNTIWPCNIGDINPEQYEYIYITDILKELLYNGITVLKYGKHGKPKYKSIQINGMCLQWYSTKKSIEECRINIKNITRIAFGSKSEINKYYKKSAKNIIGLSSFTFYYKLSNNETEIKSVTMTAETEKLGFALCWTVEILRKLQTDNKQLLILCMKDTQLKGNDKWLMYIERNCFKVFNNRKSLSCEELRKQHQNKKQCFQKSVDFVMTKRNYKAIANVGQFESVKMDLETIDNILRCAKGMLPAEMNYVNKQKQKTEKEINEQHAEILLIHCEASLYALKEKLNSLAKKLIGEKGLRF
eukprot:204650_1